MSRKGGGADDSMSTGTAERMSAGAHAFSASALTEFAVAVLARVGVPRDDAGVLGRPGGYPRPPLRPMADGDLRNPEQELRSLGLVSKLAKAG